MTATPPADTPSRILDAAEEVFAASGLAGARVNAIARESGVNKAMLYYYFQSKEGLYQAVLERVFDQIGAMASERLVDASEASLASFLDGYRTVLRAHPSFLRLVVRELADGGPRLAPLVAPRLARIAGSASQSLFAAQQRGAVNPDVNPQLALPVIVAPFIFHALAEPIIEAATQAPVGATRDLYDRTAEAILLHGLIAPESPEDP